MAHYQNRICGALQVHFERIGAQRGRPPESV
jgi:hypothetical protein